MRTGAPVTPRLCALLCALWVGYSVAFPVTNTDIWWHMAAGRLIWQEGAFLYADPFSSGAAGAPWIDLHWLFQVASFAIFSVGGLLGLVLAKALVAGGGAAVLGLVAAREIEPRWRPLVVLAVAASIHLARYLVLARPIVVTLLLISLFILVLERFRRRGKVSGLLWLVPLQVVWANVQGLFLLGPVILACYLAGEALLLALGRAGLSGLTSRLTWRDVGLAAALLLVLVAASMITPYGWQSLELPLLLFGRIDTVGSDLFTYNISENIPPWVLERFAPGRVGLFKWVTVAGFASFLCVPRDRLVPGRLLLMASFFALALLAQRNILLLHWVAGPLFAVNISGALERLLTRWPRPRLEAALPGALVGLLAAGLLGLGLHAYLGHGDGPPISRAAPFRVPQEAVSRLEALGLDRDKIFNSVRYGGYLAWRLHPRGRPFIDGRLAIRSSAHFAEHLSLADQPQTFQRFQREHGFGAVLLPTAYPRRYLALASWLYRSPRWALAFTDGTQTLFVRQGRLPAGALATPDLGDRATVQRVVKDLHRAHRDSPAVLEQAVLHLGRFLARVGELEQARHVLASRLGRRARALLARVHYLAGDLEQSEALARRLLAQGHEQHSLPLLGLIALDRGAHQQAIGYAERALALDPHDLQSRRLLERVRRELARRAAETSN